MKIAIIGTRGIPARYGGFETCAEHVSRHWVEVGHRVTVYCSRKLYASKYRTYNGCHLVYVPGLYQSSLDTISRGLLSILHLIVFQRSVRFVHLFNTGNALFLPLLKLTGKFVVISVDGIEWKRKKWGRLARFAHLAGERMAALFADSVVADNPVVENHYRLRYHGVRVSTIPYGAHSLKCDDEAYADALLRRHGLRRKQYFLFVGRLVPEKGVHHLTKVYRMLKTSFPLVIIGDDRPDSQYRNSLLAQRSKSIRFLGYVYGKEYEYLLSNALLYVSASELEGTSPSLLSAMRAGVCALVNGIEENRSTVGDAALCYPANNTGELRRLWQWVISHPPEIEAMAWKGRKHVENNFSWQSVASQYLELFSALESARPNHQSEGGGNT